MEKFGQKLRKLRKEKNLTLRELGNKLNLSFSLLAMYERGERTPSLDKLLLIADFFNVSTDYLLDHSPLEDLNRKLGIIPYLDNNNFNGDDNSIICEEKLINYYSRNSINQKYFYLKVEKDDMVNSRIHPGDLVLIRRQKHLKDGAVGVAIYKDELYIRRVYKNDNLYILQADNPDYTPLFASQKELDIIGQIIMVIFKVN
ncbi:helix-turn-helix domain-containing protein [Halothermothrix orenii]|uniref:Putative prophage repressor n=1 Tax=Halothermothrix orenii (strain H 168 / OCM 544 / DSM 9562) TaxID=373903 RepID=B8CZY8_HALOH|nr:XRE family transcriptional regulator [Halothermothrix orenii]ACL70840.1 putative prophage repressor [Halothermothrix orenii H 168]